MKARSLFPALWRDRSLSRREDPFWALQREIDHVFDDFGQGFRLPAWDEPAEPKVDVAETDNDIQLTVELPGVDENDVEVTLAEGRLTIKGEKHAEKEEKGKAYRMVERSHGSFMRSIPMPYDMDPASVDAKFAKGVLTVILPKPAEALRKTKTIDIKSA